MNKAKGTPPRKSFPLALLASLPERGVRAAAATVGGAVYQTSEVLLPSWFRRSKLYQVTISRAMRVVVGYVGGVDGVLSPSQMPLRDLAVRKTVGNTVELASILAVGWSPLWLMAAVADITGGTKVYLRTLVAELKRDGLLPADVDIASFEELLNRAEKTSGLLADTIDIPPTNVADMRASWVSLRHNVAALPKPETMAHIFAELQRASNLGGRTLLEVSSLIALGAVRTGIHLGNTYVFQYYQEALGAIFAEGLSAYAQRIAAPYLSAAGRHMDPRAPSYTQRLLKKARRRLKGVRPRHGQS